METRVSVVVTAVCDSAPLRALLARLQSQCEEVGGELFLAVNVAPERLGADVCSKLESRVDRLVFASAPGKSHSLNAAVRSCIGEIVAFTDDDAQPARGWLKALVAPLQADPRISGCGGPVLPVYPPGGPPRWYRRLIARRRSFFLGPIHFLGNRDEDYAPRDLAPLPLGANCAFRRRLLLEHPYPTELGPNRESGLRGGEDAAVALRLIRAGHQIRYVARAVVYHPVDEGRMTLAYAREGFEMQGVENARIHHLTGVPHRSVSDLERRARGLEGGSIKAFFRGRDRQLARELRGAYLRSMAAEFESLLHTPHQPRASIQRTF
jgi:hypothetical protein